MHVEGPQVYQMNHQIISFQNMSEYVWHAIGKKWRFGQEKRFFAQKKHLKIAFFGELSDLGRFWTANGWQQVNFRPTPGNVVVWLFKLSMWEVGGIKIVRIQARNIFSRRDTEICRKVIFWGYFWWFLRSGVQIIAKSATFKIGVFWVISDDYITLYVM